MYKDHLVFDILENKITKITMNSEYSHGEEFETKCAYTGVTIFYLYLGEDD